MPNSRGMKASLQAAAQPPQLPTPTQAIPINRKGYAYMLGTVERSGLLWRETLDDETGFKTLQVGSTVYCCFIQGSA